MRTVRNAGSFCAVKERDVIRDIRDWLCLHGWFVVRVQQSMGCHKGMSDIVAVKSGRVLFVEVKAPKGKQRPAQVDFQREIEEHGGVYVLARSIEDLEGIA
jgi:Holliday junction resolvase